MRGFRRFFGEKDERLAAVEADITAFGEELARFDLTIDGGGQGGQGSDPDLLDDFGQALDAYEQAKRDLLGDRDLADAHDALRTLDTGRRALARAEARASGRPLPQENPACFFDARHGPSTTEVRWVPDGGSARLVPVCAADAVRLADGLPPASVARSTPARTVRPAKVPATPAGQVRARTARYPDGRTPATTGSSAPSGPPRTARVPETPQPQEEPYGNWPLGTPEEQRAAGGGSRDIALARPAPGVPVLLVARLWGDAHGQAFLTTGRALTLGAPRRPSGQDDRRGVVTVVPVPASEGDPVRVTVESSGSWRVWLQSPDHRLRVLGGSAGGLRLRSAGDHAFRYAGDPGREFVFTHHGGGPYSVDVLGSDLTVHSRLCAGKGTGRRRFAVPGPGLHLVTSRSSWSLEPV